MEFFNATFALQDLEELENNETNELIINLMTNLLDSAIEREITNFNNLNNSQIPTKDVLNETQIGDKSDTDEKLPEVPIIEELNSLKKFVSFFEQQKS
ncbi:10488_t:CDS:2, partial [Racocetra fulgida]